MWSSLDPPRLAGCAFGPELRVIALAFYDHGFVSRFIGYCCIFCNLIMARGRSQACRLLTCHAAGWPFSSLVADGAARHLGNTLQHHQRTCDRMTVLK